MAKMVCPVYEEPNFFLIVDEREHVLENPRRLRIFPHFHLQESLNNVSKVLHVIGGQSFHF